MEGKPNMKKVKDSRPVAGYGQGLSKTQGFGQAQAGQDLDFGLGVSGNKIKKGHKLPEKYQVSTTQQIASKPNLKPSSPPSSKMQTEPQLKTETMQFETYMQIRTVNPDNREIYSDVLKDKEQLRKISSKPFDKTRMSSARQKQELIQDQQSQSSSQVIQQQQQPLHNNGSMVSEGSTKLSSNQSNSKQSHQHQKQESQDLAGFEKELSTTTRSQIQNTQSVSKKPFKLTDIVKTEKIPQEQVAALQSALFKPDQWILKSKFAKNTLEAIIQEKSEDIKSLQSYISDLRSRNKLPKDFDKNVKNIVNQIREQSDAASQISDNLDNSRFFEINGINQVEEVRDLDLELADQEIQDQQQKWKKLNEMMEESIDQISELSSDDIRKRALFITDIGRQSKKYGEDSQVQEEERNEEPESDSKSQTSSTSKKLTRREKQEKAYFIELNKRLAWMDEDEKLSALTVCDKLPEEAQKRLEELMEGIENFNGDHNDVHNVYMEPNPYKLDAETTHDIDEKIQQYIFEFEEEVNLNQGILDENVLPSDKELREKAAERILQQKLESVNDSLMEIIQSEQSKQVDKIKVKGLCEKYRQIYDYTPSEYLKFKVAEIENLSSITDQSKQLLDKLEAEQGILEDLQDIKGYLDEALQSVYQISISGQEGDYDPQELERIKKTFRNMALFESLANENAQLVE